MRLIRFEPAFEAWQTKARHALASAWPPDSVVWQETTTPEPALQLFEAADESSCPAPRPRVPKRFVESARLAARHAKPEKWSLLYRVLWRLTHGEPRLLDNPVDSDTIQLAHFEKEVRKDAYRMTAFLRFREVAVADGMWSVAWYEPEHDTLQLNAEFFVNRFANLRWSILTPRRCMHWDTKELSFSDGVQRSSAPTADEMEPLWIAYYSKIFNPARLNIRAMQAQLLKRNWKNLPEAAVIEPLIRAAPQRVEVMLARSSAQSAVGLEYSLARPPETQDWTVLRGAAAGCRACPLWRNASCTVFGEGPLDAKVVFVGEQPGDQEDRAGRPFVGPAGQVFDRALAAAGINRSGAYVTNAVKHFKFELRGKRRIHQTPNARDIAACRPWLQAELEWIKPRLVVALGGTASHALFGSPIKVLQNRGALLDSLFGLKTLVTVHPSSLLRLPSGMDVEAHFNAFVADLRCVAVLLN